MRVIKVGSLYVTPLGTLTSEQSKALRVSVTETGQPDTAPRFVKLRPRVSRLSPAVTSNENNY